MSDTLVSVQHGHVTTTSRQIATKFTKRHDTVLRKIESLRCSKNFTDRNFAVSEYIDSTGRACKEYTVTLDGFTFLAMGFTGEIADKYKEEYITEFRRMEQQLLANAQTATEIAQPIPGADNLTVLEFKNKPLRVITQGGIRWWVLPDVEAATDTQLFRAMKHLDPADHRIAAIPHQQIDQYQRVTNHTTQQMVVNDNGLKKLCRYYINAGVNAFLTWGKAQWLTRPDVGVCATAGYDPDQFYLIHKSSLESGACVCTPNDYGTLTTSPVNPESVALLKAARGFVDGARQDGYLLIKPEDLLKRLAL